MYILIPIVICRKTQSTPVKPKARRPPGSSPSSTSSTPDNTMRFEGTNDIRNYIYQEWQQKKMATAKQGLSAKKRLEKEIQLKKDKVRISYTVLMFHRADATLAKKEKSEEISYGAHCKFVCQYDVFY